MHQARRAEAFQAVRLHAVHVAGIVTGLCLSCVPPSRHTLALVVKCAVYFGQGWAVVQVAETLLRWRLTVNQIAVLSVAFRLGLDGLP